MARIRLALLVFALGSALGVECSGGKGQTFAALIPEASSVGTYSLFTVAVRVSSPTPIQAFELGLHWDPERLYPMDVTPHPEFDDDGAFFISPHFDLMAGKLDRVVDLRHGGAGAAGSFTVATVQFLSLGSQGPTVIGMISGGLADGSGNEIPVNVVPVTITINP